MSRPTFATNVERKTTLQTNVQTKAKLRGIHFRVVLFANKLDMFVKKLLRNCPKNQRNPNFGVPETNELNATEGNAEQANVEADKGSEFNFEQEEE